MSPLARKEPIRGVYGIPGTVATWYVPLNKRKPLLVNWKLGAEEEDIQSSEMELAYAWGNRVVVFSPFPIPVDKAVEL